MKRNNLLVTITTIAVTLLLSLYPANAVVSFHDLGGAASPGNITTENNPAITVDLIDFSNGSDTGADFSISGANGIVTTASGVTLPPAGGTPAGNLFLASGIDLADGILVEGGNSGSGSTTFTFSGLSSSLHYDVALYGDRNTSADGRERFTLNGADSAVNQSSAFKIGALATDMETRPNSVAGDVVRWTNIDPGADGTFTIDIDPEVTSLSNIAYLSGVRLESSPAVVTPSPTSFEIFHDLGGEPSPGNITTQPDLGTTVEFVNLADGAATDIQFSIQGANGIDLRTGTVTRPPNAGTPAGDLFLASGIDLDDGLVFEGGNGGSGSTVFTLSGLDPTVLYDLALYGDRNASQDGVERFTLLGAGGATNSSSTGIVNDFIADMQTRPNSVSGDVIRWTGINPGLDGIIMIDIDPEFTSPSNIAYLSGLRLAFSNAIVPEPTTAALALLGLGGLAMRRRRTCELAE